MPKLIPPDKKQCQAVALEGCRPNSAQFMILGPAFESRCENKPTVIIKEVKPADDGKRGSMSLCAACLKIAVRQLGAKAFTVKRLKKSKTP